MKKVVTVFLAVTLLTASMPAFALAHGGSHDPADVNCARDCELLLKNCEQAVDTIQQKIRRFESAIRKEGADQKKVADIKALQQKLEDAQELLHSIEKGGH